MSKIGKKPVRLEGASAMIEEGVIRVKGSLGELLVPVLPGVTAKIEGSDVILSIEEEKKQWKSNWGTLRSLVQNAVEGVTKGFEKTLLLEGVGYRMTKEGEGLSFALGFSHPVKMEAIPGIKFELEKATTLRIKGIDKNHVGQVAANIRALKKPEPYKGKGFRYQGEVIRRKAGKKAGTQK